MHKRNNNAPARARETGAFSCLICGGEICTDDFANEVLAKCKHWNLSDRKPQLFRYEAVSDKDIRFGEKQYD